MTSESHSPTCRSTWQAEQGWAPRDVTPAALHHADSNLRTHNFGAVPSFSRFLYIVIERSRRFKDSISHVPDFLPGNGYPEGSFPLAGLQDVE